MDSRAFLEWAEESATGPTEVYRRGAAGRAYHALFGECLAALRRRGVTAPPRDNAHAFVRLRFIYAGDPVARDIGRALERSIKLRNEADYQLDKSGRFRSANEAEQAIREARDAIATLDAIEADPARRAALIASIRP